ncbi:N-glycosidase [Podospora aff. communis PSN243]|uniref:N-glycosidase n=1 Tax=Podospora aff. communis PSN243 TaxID=3040156 RepID=A0AAV9G263_9PEZI|nr:N-glycosidase [Podospora aff. communis PSN243]
MPPKAKAAASTPADEKILFFYMPDAKDGELCQWFPSPFPVSKSTIDSLISYDTASGKESVDSEIIHFTCAEQFMMYCKAGRFHDTETQRKIMATSDPKTQKRLGKTITGFYDGSWDEVKSDVVVAGNMAKFGQNPKLKRKLLATGDKTLVEAASKDRVWGIGYTAKHAMQFRDHWGENRLGKALMVVRDRLRGEEPEG